MAASSGMLQRTYYSTSRATSDDHWLARRRFPRHLRFVLNLTQILNFIILRVSFSFCTRTLYGTYSEQRSGLVVLVARWTYSFLLLHNCVAIAAYAITVVTKVPSELEVEQLLLASVILEEVALVLITLAVPFSYITGLLAQCCCGISRDNNMEMDKVDKIYTDVWTTPSARSSSTAAASAPVSTSTTLPAAAQSGNSYQFSVSRVWSASDFQAYKMGSLPGDLNPGWTRATEQAPAAADPTAPSTP